MQRRWGGVNDDGGEGDEGLTGGENEGGNCDHGHRDLCDLLHLLVLNRSLWVWAHGFCCKHNNNK